MNTESEIRIAALRHLRKNTNKNGQVVRVDLGHCWEWTGKRDRTGYGIFQVPVEGKKRVRGASRAAWWLKRGCPGDLFVLHKCDNRSCVRIDHLFTGTAKDNSEDARIKGRTTLGFWHQKVVLEEISEELGREATMKELIMVNTWRCKVFEPSLRGKSKDYVSEMYLKHDMNYVLDMLGIKK